MSQLTAAQLAKMGIDANAQIETWQSIYKKSVKLADMIAKSCKHIKPAELFDKVVTIPKGGLYPANIVTREIGCRSIDILTAAMGSYPPGSNHRQKITYGQLPSRDDIEGKNILIIDEVCDSGRTLLDLVNRLKRLGAKQIKTGVLHYKPGKNETGFIPNWYVEATDNWIVYPWEINEFKGRNSRPRAMKKPAWSDRT
ncbi:hypothetical protein HYW35_04080 [Candidatus Saccharibacteria bacterium]|nr:hypothetical protein [Candidatus Saccharibacteria bacterium]